MRSYILLTDLTVPPRPTLGQSRPTGGVADPYLKILTGSDSENVFRISVSDPDPHSMGFWIRIRIANAAHPDPEGGT
jgi:hypothetical protein